MSDKIISYKNWKAQTRKDVKIGSKTGQGLILKNAAILGLKTTGNAAYDKIVGYEKKDYTRLYPSHPLTSREVAEFYMQHLIDIGITFKKVVYAEYEASATIYLFYQPYE
jgi:hypothetical protein